jgi:peptide/nickel transport system substrate-binding protein
MVVRWEPTDLAPKIPGSGNPTATKRLFNAQLALSDSQGMPRPYMAEALPQLNTDSWRVFPDGRMETTYRLRPGLAWHDGQPLRAEDFVFAYRVYTGGLGVFSSSPQDQMEAITAPDPRTLVIRWHSPYADAAALIQGDLEPLPQHLLEGPFAAVEQDPATRDTFVTDPYWTMEFVGAGPFRLERWEPGSSLEGAAFEAHALGRPKIDRLLVRVMTDENTVLSNVLAGNVEYATTASLRFEHALVLKREWVSASKGTVLLRRGGPVFLPVQMRPEYADPPALLDLRVRRALAHSINRQQLNDGLFEGEGFPSEGLVPADAPHYEEVDRAIAKYPYDPRRSEQLMNEAGFRKDREGFFVSDAGERFRPDLRVTAGPEIERTQAILTDVWRRAGFEIQPSVQSVASGRDIQTRHTFPAIGYRGGLPVGERGWTSAEIGTSANRWAGENRGGWSSPEYDLVWESFLTTLDRPERGHQITEMMRLLSDQLPAFMLYFSVQVMAIAPDLQGVEAGTQGAGRLIRESLPHWNIHEWELR